MRFWIEKCLVSPSFSKYGRSNANVLCPKKQLWNSFAYLVTWQDSSITRLLVVSGCVVKLKFIWHKNKIIIWRWTSTCNDTAHIPYFRNKNFLFYQLWLSLIRMKETFMYSDILGININSWITGKEPIINDKSVNMKACVTSGYQTNCSCCREIDIQVRNCSTFLVYNLTATPTCPERFCFGGTNVTKFINLLSITQIIY